MMLIKLLMIPFKFALKLALYSIGGIIFAVMFVLLVVLATLSGFVKKICSILITLVVVGGAALIISQPEYQAVILILLALVFFILVSVAPDIIMKIFTKISEISFKLFKAASFKVYRRKI